MNVHFQSHISMERCVFHVLKFSTLTRGSVKTVRLDFSSMLKKEYAFKKVTKHSREFNVTKDTFSMLRMDNASEKHNVYVHLTMYIAM